MKFILIKKTRKNLPFRSELNENFADLFRILVIEFIEYITIQEENEYLLEFIYLISELK